jgi:uncharacterized membrane protein YsdA (DUF1294 family)
MSPRALIILAYVLMSMVTLCVYACDKRASSRGRRRVPENTLHALALLGGWPGAIAAQQLLRHKRRKWNFAAITWLVVAIHVTAWVGVWRR